MPAFHPFEIRSFVGSLRESLSRSLHLVLLVSACGLPACFPPGDGLEPPSDDFNFPVGLALSPNGTRLYVANSDYDLRYNSGVLQVLDTDAIRAHLPQHCRTDDDCSGGTTCANGTATGVPVTFTCVDASGSWCGELGPRQLTGALSNPGPCAPVPLSRNLVLASARIAPFVADLRYVPAGPNREARLVLPVRGDATLHWADVEDDVAGSGPLLDCGQARDGAPCDANHRRGDQRSEAAPDGTKLPTEPFGIAVSDDGGAVFLGHQSQGSVSVFENGRNGPALQSVLSGLPSNPMGLAVVPAPRAARRDDVDYRLGVLVSYRFFGDVAPHVELLRYFDSESAAPALPYLHRAARGEITTNTVGLDSRGLAVDVSRRTQCEDECAASAECEESEASEGCGACLLACAAVPFDAYLANRSPDSLLVGRSRPVFGELTRDDVPNFSDAAPVRGGPNRVVVASVRDEAGRASQRVFLLSFDAQLLYVYDPERREFEAHVATGQGPQAVVVDEARALAYVAHFTNSYVGVVDLDKRHSTYGRMLLTVGEPRSPQSAK